MKHLFWHLYCVLWHPVDGLLLQFLQCLSLSSDAGVQHDAFMEINCQMHCLDGFQAENDVRTTVPAADHEIAG